MKLPEDSGGETVDQIEARVEPAQLIARLDGINVFQDVYGTVAAREIVAAVDRRLVELAEEGLQVRSVGVGVYAITANLGETARLEAVVSRLQAAIGDRQIQTVAGPAVATLSVGGVAGGVKRKLDLLKQANSAAETASKCGPAGRRIEDAAGDRRGSKVAIARRTLTALHDNRIALAYQPVLRADRSEIVAFNECLARVLEPSGGIVPAGEFIPAMEDLQLTRPLDRRVLALALEELAANPTLRLSVNLSAQSLCDPGWLRILTEVEKRAPGLAARLIVEITASAIIADEPRAYAFIAEIRQHGCAIALDDFGAGFSAFRHLKQLRPDILKIDGAFVVGVSKDPANRAMIESIMVVARHFEMMTVGERVNDPEDANALRRLGVDCLQGNSYGQPTIEPDWRTEIWANEAAI
jgi:EAL domain-containing protein (putative c-di-GMP-specific phosphodiesterase class I)